MGGEAEDPRDERCELKAPLLDARLGRVGDHRGAGLTGGRARRGYRVACTITVISRLPAIPPEVPETEVSGVRDLVRAEMVGAYPLDPSLAVDVGVGDDWAEAKS